MGWGDQMRDLKTIHRPRYTYALETGEEDGMIRWEILKQYIKFTYELEMDEMDDENWIGWSDERS